MIVPPYFEDFGKRLVKTPKVYWGDSGLACYLLGITSEAELQRSPFLGQLFEGFVAAEILKSQVNQGDGKELHYFRDQQGLEVDFLLPRPNAGLWLMECKAGKTVRPAMAAPASRFAPDDGKALDPSDCSIREVALCPGHECCRSGSRSDRIGALHRKPNARPLTDCHGRIERLCSRRQWESSLQASVSEYGVVQFGI
jgi:hypothetical protein